MDEVEEDGLPEDAFPAAVGVPGQARSREIYARIEASLKEYAWYEEYLNLRAMRLDWRKAAFVAWSATPKSDRTPPTLGALADLLGVNDRTMRGWVQRQPELVQLVAQFQLAPLLQHRRDVVDALVTSASTPAAANSADRKLFFQMTGDLEEKSQQRLVGSDEEPPIIILPAKREESDGDPAPAGTAGSVPGQFG